MKIKFGLLITATIFVLSHVPFFSTAQADRSGNHCAVQKSPYRLSMDSGKVLYTSQCLSCHQANGLGISGVNPALTGKLVSGDKSKLLEFILDGRNPHEAMDVKLSEKSLHGNAEMEDQEIAFVLTYIRNSFGNKASSVKLSEVKSARKKLN
jgi:mono/diheme cytochrome c family protein